MLFADARDVAEVPLDQHRRVVAEAGKPVPREFDRLRVAVDAEQPSVRLQRLEDRLGVSAKPDGRVHVAAARTHGQCLDGFGEHHRLVTRTVGGGG